MSQLPSITISTTDHDHIFALIERLEKPKELDDTPGKVSIFSPAGAALLGLSVNDQIQWPLNSKKTLRIKVIGVE